MKEKILELLKKESVKKAIPIITYVGISFVAILLAYSLITYIRYGGKIPVSVAFSPSEEVGVKTNFTFEFSSDVVETTSVGNMLEKEEVIFTPKIKGRFKWLSQKMLRFYPEVILPPATSFKVEVLPKICKKKNIFIKGDRVFSFYTERLKIIHSQPRFIYERKEKMETRIEWTIEFNQNVSPKKLYEFCKIYYDLKVGVKNIPYKITPEGPAKVFKFITEPIKRGNNEQFIKIRIEKGLLGEKGDLGLLLDFVGDFKIEPNLKVYQVLPQQNERQCWIQIEFSSPVDTTFLKEYIKLKPEIEFRLEQDNRYCNIHGDFKPGESYEVYIREGVPAEDGTFLQQDFETTVVIQDLEPSLAFKDKGIFLCRKGFTNLAIESVKIAKFHLEAHKVFINNLVYLLSDYDSDDYWYEPSNLGKKVYSEDISVDVERNQIKTTYFNLNQFLKDKRKGVFIVKIYDCDERWWRNDSQLVLATDIGIMGKKSEDELFVSCNSLKDLTPISNVSIALISTNNQVITEGRTNGDGVCVIKGLKEKMEDFTPFIITASTEDDFSFLKFDDCRMPIAAFDVSGRPHLLFGYEAYLYPERGVYRPGEVANVVSIVRGSNVSLPESFPVKLTLLDPTNKLFKEFGKNITNTGIVDFQIEIPDYAKTGRYIARLDVGESEIGRCDFLVEEFIPDRIKVEVSTDKQEYQVGEKVNADVLGICLFGPPAVGRKVEARYQISAQPFTPTGWKDFVFGDADKGFKEINIPLEEGLLDENGKYRFTFDIPKDIYPPAMLNSVISASVLEPGGRAVSAYKGISIHPYPFYIGLRPKTEGYAEIGKRYSVDYVVVNTKGQKVIPNVLTCSFYRIVWHSMLKKDKDGYYRYVSERSENLINQFRFSPKGQKEIGVTPQDYGEYKIVLTCPETKSQASIKFYASGWGYAPWSLANPDKIELSLEKEHYKIGETARLLVKAPFAGKLILTMEREKVFGWRIINMSENTATIEVPVEDLYKPNIYLTATIIRKVDDSNLPMRAFGIIPLKLDCGDKRIPVQINSSAHIRSKQKLNIEVQAETNCFLTIACVDEGILQLTEFQNPNPMDFFYGKKRLDVSSYDIYSLILPEVKGEGKGSAGDILEKVRKKHITPVNVRRVKPIAFFSGIVKADETGKAKIDFYIPEFQGRVRVYAVASNGDRFGAGKTDVRVSDPIVLTPTIPRFLAPKDKFTLPVFTYNDCGKKGNFTVSLKIKCPIKIIGETSKVLEIGPKKEKGVFFDLQVGEAIGKAEFKIFASGLGEKTKATCELPIRPPLPLITKSGSARIPAGTSYNLELPGGWIEGTQMGKIVISSFPAIKFSKSIQYLLRYPHGCIEQTTSRVFPLLYFEELAKSAEPALFKHNSAAYYINEGIAKLETMSLDNGAFSFWPGIHFVNYWGSIYASHFLVEAKKKGFNVNEWVYKRMLSYLNEIAKKHYDNYYGREQQVYACYVLSLANQPPKSTIQYLKENEIKNLSLYSQFQLAGCFAKIGDMKTARFLLPSQIQPQSVSRETGGNFNSSIRANAIMLDILAQYFPESPGIPILIKELSQKAEAGEWYNTQDNAFAFLAIGKALKSEKKAKFTGEAIISGKVYTFNEQGKTIEGKELSGQKVNIKVQGVGNCYVYWNVEGIPKGFAIEEYDKGIKVRREFLNKDGGNIDYQNIKQGDLIVAKITMSAMDKDLENVIICDMLPAGFEIENPRLATTANIPWIGQQSYKPDYMDIRDDRLLLYTSVRRRDTQTFYYGLRAVTRGEFILPPILSESMYDPTYTCVASSGMIKIVP
ncbi:MAG: alpha-2-macroglobulin [bacterium]